MSAVDLVAVIVTVVCVGVVVLLVLTAQALIVTMRQLRETIDELRGEGLPMLNDLHTTVNKAGDELKRVDQVMGRVERVVATADLLSRLSRRILTPPLIKTVAFVKGIGRGVIIFRRGRNRKALPSKRVKQMG